MSFLRREKSKSNIKASFGFGSSNDSNLNSTSNKESGSPSSNTSKRSAPSSRSQSQNQSFSHLESPQASTFPDSTSSSTSPAVQSPAGPQQGQPPQVYLQSPHHNQVTKPITSQQTHQQQQQQQHSSGSGPSLPHHSSLSKKPSSSSITPTISSSISSINSSNNYIGGNNNNVASNASYKRRDSPGFPFNARYDDHDGILFNDDNNSINTKSSVTTGNNNPGTNTQPAFDSKINSAPHYFHHSHQPLLNDDCSPRSSIVSLNRSRNNSDAELPRGSTNNRIPSADSPSRNNNSESSQYTSPYNQQFQQQQQQQKQKQQSQSQKQSQKQSSQQPSQQPSQQAQQPSLKDNYRGFHANRRNKGINIPPLSHPIKPKFKKKSGSLLGKLIYSTSSRKDSDASSHSTDSQLAMSPITSNNTSQVPMASSTGSSLNHSTNDAESSGDGHSSRHGSVGSSSAHQKRKSVSSTGSGSSSKHKFRISSITSHHPHNNNQQGTNTSNQTPSSNPPNSNPTIGPRSTSTESSATFNPNEVFNLDISPNELQDIIKPPHDAVSNLSRSNKNSVASSGNYSPTDSSGRLPSVTDYEYDRHNNDGSNNNGNNNINNNVNIKIDNLRRSKSGTHRAPAARTPSGGGTSGSNTRIPLKKALTSMGNIKNASSVPGARSVDGKNSIGGSVTGSNSAGGWKAPDSWDVKFDNTVTSRPGDEDSEEDDDNSFTDSEDIEDEIAEDNLVEDGEDGDAEYLFSGVRTVSQDHLVAPSSEYRDGDRSSVSSASSVGSGNLTSTGGTLADSTTPRPSTSGPDSHRHYYHYNAAAKTTTPVSSNHNTPVPAGEDISTPTGMAGKTSAGASITPQPNAMGKKRSRHQEDVSDISSSRSHLPVLYGSRQRSHIANTASDASSYSQKGPNHIVRVFKEDNTFTTILCPLETTTADLLTIVRRKFFLESVNNYQISVYIGNCVKVLEPFEKPLKIQMGLLMLSGYSSKDSLKIIGREDLSFVCKFVVENILLRSLTHEEETMLSKDYVDVNISSLNLKNIPIIFHQHTYEIERLVASDNPSIHIPKDFIQSCNNLTSIVFAHNGCSKFPMNFLEARKLTHLDMEKNFLDELPSKFGHLRNLTHLRLNSNQLSSLPKSFGKLKNLIVLNLSSNYFNSYPEAINDLINLKDLDLSYNDLSIIPDSIAKLTKLSKLNLCTNKLSKALPECFTSLVSLKRLDIRFNKISNVDVLGTLPNLEVAYASKNNISAFSDRMESLRLLHFDRNPITSLEFQNLLPLLTVLDLSRAKLTSVPAEFISKIPHVEKFVLDKNHLVNLPDQLGDLSKLTFLSLYGNNLQLLPTTIGKLTSLQYLDLHSNNLQVLPDDIWNLKSLSVLNVSSNILTSFPKPPLSVAKRISSSANFRDLGAEPANTEDHTRPYIHSANENDIIVERSVQNIPTNLQKDATESSSSLSDSLLVLTLADNRLTDECFESITILIGLKSLNLSYNDLLEIPEGALRRLSRLTELYLSGNELTNLPADDIEDNKALKLMFLNNNKMVSLPAELSKLANLQHLDVGSNQLKYNISNWPYDWNWHWNKNLRYLNFSGNKRFEIKQSHIKNPDTGEDFDSLLVLKELKVLGLIDVTLTTTSVPDQNADMRIRTTASELDNIGYGVSDSMGMRDCVSSRDIFIQKFRGNENEVLICSFDGKSGVPHQSHRISHLAKSLLVPNFTNELNKLKSDEGIHDAIRRTFLILNKEINGILAAQKNNFFTASSTTAELASLNLAEDATAGCSVTIVYIKDKHLYTANIGDIEALLSKNNGDYTRLTTKHDPTTRSEFERIRASGGYVSGDGALDGVLPVSRGVGFFQYLPHTHSGPDIKDFELTAADDMIVIATKVFWDYVSYELAVDILRQEKGDPMIAAQKLRDYAICYGATDKLAVNVITLGQRKLNKFGSNALYHNLGRENDVFTNKKRRDRALQPGDLALRRLEDEIEPPVGELALVFTDIKNSTLLWDTYPVAMRSAIKLHNTIMRRQLRIVGGYEVKTEGDAFMVSFPSPTSALLWCFNVQHQLMHEDWPTEILETDQCCEVTDGKGNVIFRGLSVRMGVHWGSPVCELDMVTRRMDYFGPMVNRASRISALADGGQIAMSSDFFDEIKTLYDIHFDIIDEKTTINEAYQGNIRAGEIIEKEINSLEEHGRSYFELGEKKLKGLETPELVTLAFPENLEVRFEIFQKRLFKSESNSVSRVVGTLPVQSIYGLRTVSLKLENICSSMNGGYHINESFQKNSSGLISEKIDTDFQESDLISLFNHVVTRIENCVVTLELRQKLNEVNGQNGRIDFISSKNILTVMQEFYDIVYQDPKLARALQKSSQSKGGSTKSIEDISD